MNTRYIFYENYSLSKGYNPMIRTVNGTVQAVTDQDITVNIGPIGLALQVPNPSQFQVGAAITVATYLHWNQEQGPSLFGFVDELDRAVFLLIISCAGIGPKIALAALGQLGSANILIALQTSNEKVLSQVSGIGAKKAEQIIAHLRHKADKVAKNFTGAVTGKTVTQWDDVTQALTSLNYTRAEIANTMQHLGQRYADVQLPFDQLIRHALSFLAKKT